MARGRRIAFTFNVKYNGEYHGPFTTTYDPRNETKETAARRALKVYFIDEFAQGAEIYYVDKRK